MFDNLFHRICPGKHFKILVRINLNYKHLVLYSSFESISLRSSVGFVAASRAEDPSSNPRRISHAYIFFLLDLWVIMSMHFFLFIYAIVLYYYSYKLSVLIGLRYSTILNTPCAFSLVYREYRLICKWFSRYKLVKCDYHCKGLHLWCAYFLNTFKNIP